MWYLLGTLQIGENITVPQVNEFQNETSLMAFGRSVIHALSVNEQQGERLFRMKAGDPCQVITQLAMRVPCAWSIMNQQCSMLFPTRKGLPCSCGANASTTRTCFL